METELEKRWREAERQKNISPDELKALVQEMERGITIPEDWNRRCEESIREEKKEIEARYGIRIGQTEIYCPVCGEPVDPQSPHRYCTKKEIVKRVRVDEHTGVYVWCESREQRVAEVVCKNKLHYGDCIKTEKGCRPKPKPMAEDAKQYLAELKKNNPKMKRSQGNIGQKIKDFGRSRLATLLGLPVNTVSSWIKRGKIPKKHVDNVVHFLTPNRMGRTRLKMHHFAP